MLARLAMVVVALVVACRGPAPAKVPPAEAEPKASAPSASASAKEKEPAADSPPPRLALRLSANKGRLLELSLQNHDAAEVSVSSGLVLEKEQQGRFVALDGAGASLRRDCTRQVERCLSLAPGAELLPPPLRSPAGDGQCECADCPPLSPGRYRVVVRGCAGTFTLTSQAIALPE